MDELLTKIKEAQRQMARTQSPMRKRDLQRHLNRLWKKYEIAKRENGQLKS